jgi:CRISPR/Cas system-associated exonuclease Cas4 (RecB family)
MSEYYNPKRVKNLYKPGQHQPFKISRSKIDLYLDCRKCFYLDRKLGVGRPPGYPFSLNSAVDTLLKKEFDFHRVKSSKHPLMEQYGIDAVPFNHQKIDEWRENFVGVQYHHQSTNFIVTGAIDDVWINTKSELYVVDYKSTAKVGEVSIDADWQISYKRQMEVYQWLLRRNEFKVSDTGYFVYANGQTDLEAFDGKLEFDVKIIPYEGKDGWVEEVLGEIKETLDSDQIPTASEDCDFCRYREAVAGVEGSS